MKLFSKLFFVFFHKFLKSFDFIKCIFKIWDVEFVHDRVQRGDKIEKFLQRASFKLWKIEISQLFE